MTVGQLFTFASLFRMQRTELVQRTFPLYWVTFFCEEIERESKSDCEPKMRRMNSLVSALATYLIFFVPNALHTEIVANELHLAWIALIGTRTMTHEP